MVRRVLLGIVVFALSSLFWNPSEVHAQQAFGRVWGQGQTVQDWRRFYHYPYVYYPQNFWGNEYFRSANDLYYRYPREMRIPVYNRKWQNYYPQERIYHQGNHFILDIF